MRKELMDFLKSVGGPVARVTKPDEHLCPTEGCKLPIAVCDSKERPYCHGNVARRLLKRLESGEEIKDAK